MIFSKIFKKDAAVKEESVRTGFWSNPVFDNPDVLKLYKIELLRAGRCPVCGDFLFIDISFEDYHYKVVKRCINHKCDYTYDISIDFNRKLGFSVFNKPVEEKSKVNESKSNSINKSSLDVSELLYNQDKYKSPSPIIEREYVEVLPVASDYTLNKMYIVKEDSYYKAYITIMDIYDEYEWRLVSCIDNLNEDIVFDSYWDCQTRSTIVLPDINCIRRVCK